MITNNEPAPPASPIAPVSPPAAVEIEQAGAGHIRFDLRARFDDILDQLSDENLRDLSKIAERLLAQQEQDDVTSQA